MFISNFRRGLSIVVSIGASIIVSGCGFLPGFSLFESPTLYFIPVAEVANRVACELQEFLLEHRDDKAYAKHKWVLADDDVKVVLTLSTNEQGYVNFTGINAAKIGLENLQSIIASQSKISTLGAKLTIKRARSVAMTFSVSPKALQKDIVVVRDTTKLTTPHCYNAPNESPLTRLYLKDWLNNYFETINASYGPSSTEYQNQSASDFLLHNLLRPLSPPPPVPKQFKIQSVGLSTSLLLVADINAGLNQTVLGNGSAFLLPINGLGADYNSDYTHKIDLTLSVCDSTDASCNPKNTDVATLTKQCAQYGLLNPLLSVKPPRDYERNGMQYRCNKNGQYVLVS